MRRKQRLWLLSVLSVSVLVLCVFLYHTSFGKGKAKAADSIGQVTSECDKSFDEMIVKVYYPEDYMGYRYPSLPGSDSWPYENHQDMVDMCQIPDEMIEQMSTPELLDSVLAYPLLGDMDAYDDRNDGFQIVMSHFHGLEELCKRNDRTECLLEWLCSHKEYFLTPANTGNMQLDYCYNIVKMYFMRLAQMEEFGLVSEGDTGAMLFSHTSASINVLYY